MCLGPVHGDSGGDHTGGGEGIWEEGRKHRIQGRLRSVSTGRTCGRTHGIGGENRTGGKIGGRLLDFRQGLKNERFQG